MTERPAPLIAGHCYCGLTEVKAWTLPLSVVFCHCSDCKRSTGAPVAAFAAFDADAVEISEGTTSTASRLPEAERLFCTGCGSPVLSRYEYLPEQVYLPLGILDQSENLPPSLHAHAEQTYPWLHLEDGLPRSEDSARDSLNASAKGPVPTP